MPTAAELASRLRKALGEEKKSRLRTAKERAEEIRQGRPTSMEERKKFDPRQSILDPVSGALGIESPEGKRMLSEAVGGVVGTLVPPIRGLRTARVLAGGAGEALGSLFAEGSDPSKEPGRAAAGAFTRGVAGALGGEGLVKLGQKVFTKRSARLVEGADEVLEIVTKGGGVVTPGLITDSRTVDILENIAESSFLGGGRVLNTRGQAINIVEDAVADFTSKFGKAAGPEETGHIIKSLLEDGSKAFKAEAFVLSKSLDDIIGTPKVSLFELKQRAAAVLAKNEKGVAPSPTIKKVVDNILAKDDIVLFSEAQAIRSDLISIGRQVTDPIPDAAGGALKSLTPIVDKSMELAAKGISRTGAKQWRALNKFWKTGKKEFNAGVVRSIARSDPEKVFNIAIKGQAPGTIRRVRNIIVGASTKPIRRATSMIMRSARSKPWKGIQAEFLRSTIEESLDDTGKLIGAKLIKRLKGIGDESLAELFPVGRGSGEIKRLGRALELMQGKAGGEKTGTIFIQLKQAGVMAEVGGALLGAGGAINPGTAGVIILGPAMVARLFTNPIIAKAITVGVKAPLGSAAGARAAGVVSAALSGLDPLESEEVRTLLGEVKERPPIGLEGSQ